MKKAVRRGTAVLLTIFMVFCVSCCVVVDHLFDPVGIKDGFSEKWLETLKTEYSLSIPESAVYLKGYMELGRDFSVHMLFTVDAADFDGMFGEGWSEDAEGHTFSEEWYDDLADGEMPHRYDYSKQYTALFFSDADENGTVICVFVGWWP